MIFQFDVCFVTAEPNTCPITDREGEPECDELTSISPVLYEHNSSVFIVLTQATIIA